MTVALGSRHWTTYVLLKSPDFPKARKHISAAGMLTPKFKVGHDLLCPHLGLREVGFPFSSPSQGRMDIKS